MQVWNAFTQYQYPAPNGTKVFWSRLYFPPLPILSHNRGVQLCKSTGTDWGVVMVEILFGQIIGTKPCPCVTLGAGFPAGE